MEGLVRAAQVRGGAGARGQITPQASRGRARKLWQRTFGEIPPGMHVHHIDGDPYNNALENLELVEAGKHLRQHFRERVPVARVCDRCGGEYQSVTGRQRDRFCSAACRAAARRDSGVDNETRVCVVCEVSFSVSRFLATKTCSRKCAGVISGNARRGVPQPKREGR